MTLFLFVSSYYYTNYSKIKLMKGKALRKQGLHEKIAASVLLKLLSSGNERCHTTDAPIAHEQSSSNVNKHTMLIHKDKKYNYTKVLKLPKHPSYCCIQE